MSAFEAFDPERIGPSKLRLLYDYWRARCVGDAPPPRSAIDPIDIPELLAHLMLIDVQHEPFDLRYRLVGTALVEHMGHDTTGLRVEEGYVGSDWPRIRQDYETAIRDRVPVLTVNDVVGHDGRRYVYDRLLLPLSRDGACVDMLMGGAQFRPLA